MTASDKNAKPHIAILGAGPAGAAAAYSLTRDNKADVTVIERSNAVGGNAASFRIEDIWCDHGSHRLHPVADKRVIDDIKHLLGDDLLWRPRHGRILLQNRWIHFPLKPVDLVVKLPKKFTASLAFDTVRKIFPKSAPTERNFATVLEQGLGPTMSEAFYYPYVEKLWGLPPHELAVTLAERRVSGSSVFKILQKVARQIPGFKSEISGRFYYPKKGFGQITERLYEAAAEQGANFHLNSTVTKLERQEDHVTQVQYERDGKTDTLSVDRVWSTLPLSLMTKMIDPPPPPQVIEASDKMKFRGMVLIYLVLEQGQFTEFDAHYFPELKIPMSRMSETKNYHDTREPSNRTVLCAELPSDPDDDHWDLSDDELGQRMCKWLESVGLPVTAPVVKTVTRRLRQAYPVYDHQYEEQFEHIDAWLSGMKGLLSYGRQGLFAHDNTHHAMAMAYAASDCLKADGSFDHAQWAQHRKEFESHVVED